MNKPPFDDLSHLSMLELFRLEAESQSAILTEGLLELERNPAASHQLDTLMRAAHSLKGAARIINSPVAVRIAHAMEDCLAAAQREAIQLRQAEIDALLRGVDLLLHLSKCAEAEHSFWESEHAEAIQEFLTSLEHVASPPPLNDLTKEPGAVVRMPSHSALRKPASPERVLRLTAENLNRLLALAGESLVESRWLRPFTDSMQRLKRLQGDLSESLDVIRNALDSDELPEPAEARLAQALREAGACQQFLAERLQELDLFDRRSAQLSHRLYLEVLRTRMRPFSDGTRRLPRMVRDLARELGKEVTLEIRGENTQVDRDILERLETPLAHLLRNAVDHGCELPAERERAGKPAEATVQVEAHHSAGMLVVTVSDDGAGIDLDLLRRTAVAQELVAPAAADRLNDTELFEFLFLPGFSLKPSVTEISGRGVGLDIVQTMARSVRGSVRVSAAPGRGARFQLQLPLTLSVLRTLLVEVAGEPYAFPLGQIHRTLKLPRDRIETLEGRRHFTFRGRQIGLLTAHQVLDCGEPSPPGDELPVVVLGDHTARYGLVVDRFLEERELVVQPLDPRLGKVRDIQAAALMEDGAPVLIVDVDDLLRSTDKLIADGGLEKAGLDALTRAVRKRPRVLAVDDSLTVRELQRKLLTSHGYDVDVAVDGLDGWNAVRRGHYDLVITDVDMPRMDGIELTALIKKDPALKNLPVMIVSYKDHEHDRLRGLEAGADYYLTKGGFHDEALLQAVEDLLGEPEPAKLSNG